MRAVDIIARKRDGLELSAEEISFFVQGLNQGTVPDYQGAAWLMATYIQGMTRQETIDLTMEIVRSGVTLDLQGTEHAAGAALRAYPVVDKHSTGGVGDKTTLVVAPLVAAAGVKVAKISGRGLQFTGGTLDKLESIPGFRVHLSAKEFQQQLQSFGLVVAGQSADLAPADGKLYALRDVTATVGSLPLIASSIMSKKIAAGASCIVLDVKVGHGAFMQTREQAEALAELMVEIGRGLERRVRAIISDMDQPLGNAVGNALELKEALDTVQGGGPSDFRQHCLTVAAQMQLLAGLLMGATDAPPEKQATAHLSELLDNGQAYAKFRDWIGNQGGDVAYIDDPERLPQARFKRILTAPRSGYVSALNAQQVGHAAMLLGGGRTRKEDAIDLAVGVELQAKIGDRVQQGQPLLTIHANDERKLTEARERLLRAYSWCREPVSPPPLIHQIIG